MHPHCLWHAYPLVCATCRHAFRALEAALFSRDKQTMHAAARLAQPAVQVSTFVATHSKLTPQPTSHTLASYAQVLVPKRLFDKFHSISYHQGLAMSCKAFTWNVHELLCSVPCKPCVGWSCLQRSALQPLATSSQRHALPNDEHLKQHMGPIASLHFQIALSPDKRSRARDISATAYAADAAFIMCTGSECLFECNNICLRSGDLLHT